MSKLELARRTAELSQKQLASKCHCSQQMIACLENGTKQPSLALAQRIAKALNKKVEELFE